MFTESKNESTGTVLAEWAVHYRRVFSVIISAGCFFILLVSKHSWRENNAADFLMDLFGIALISAAVLGRMWSAFFISGYKEDRIVTEGPYAIVRNPLYVFSFLGAIGVGLSSKNLLVLGILILTFLFYYPFVILYEENHLKSKFGQVYLDYAAKVPRFFPKHFNFIETDIYPAKPRHFRRSLSDAMWFFWFYMFMRIIERMHQADWLPVWFHIP